MLTASGSGTRTWLGQGLGPVGLQVQAAMLADIQRVYDESLPQRLEPINFKDINLWHKVRCFGCCVETTAAHASLLLCSTCCQAACVWAAEQCGAC